MKYMKTEGCRANIYVTIPGEGVVERGFRNKGEAIKYLQHHYGNDWKKLRPKFTPKPQLDDDDGLF